MHFSRNFGALVLALASPALHAQTSALALTSGAAAQALYTQWFAPQATQSQRSAQQLQQALQHYCAGEATTLDAVRQQFVHTSRDWQRLSAVAMGPQVERRTARMVDFQPIRLQQLQSALLKVPQSLEDMERIGAPAKGFPVLEYLLWTVVVQPKTPSCQYATLVAADTAQELQALQQDLQKTVQQATPDFESNSEFLNQWVGGLDRLRWLSMEKPLRRASEAKPAQVTRMASGDTLAHWLAQWQALRALAVGDAQQPNLHISIVAMIEARGWSRLAQELRDAVQATDAAMSQIQQVNLASVLPASKALGQLKHLVENEVALALDVSIGFSDADGD